MKDLRTSALIGAALGVVVFGGLAGIAFYDGLKSTAKVTAPVLVKQPAQATDQVPMRHRKADRLDRRHAEQPYFGRVLPFDISSVI